MCAVVEGAICSENWLRSARAQSGPSKARERQPLETWKAVILVDGLVVSR
jgi:hypothetical protein